MALVDRLEDGKDLALDVIEFAKDYWAADTVRPNIINAGLSLGVYVAAFSSGFAYGRNPALGTAGAGGAGLAGSMAVMEVFGRWQQRHYGSLTLQDITESRKKIQGRPVLAGLRGSVHNAPSAEDLELYDMIQTRLQSAQERSHVENHARVGAAYSLVFGIGAWAGMVSSI